MSNRFVFVVPMFNASATLPRMLHSVYGQSYDNWRIELIDDMSSDVERDSYLEAFQVFRSLEAHDTRLHYTFNKEKKWEVANVLHGISRCNDDDIVCRLDADDWLTDLDALAIIDQCYQQTGCDALWTAHRWGFSDRNISGPLPDGADPYKHPWVSSHLKTFRKSLLTGVSDENFRGPDGGYVRRAGDQCLYLPVLHKSKKRIFLPRVTYHYTINEDGGRVYQTDDAKFQKAEADFIRQRGFVSTGDAWNETTSFKRNARTA